MKVTADIFDEGDEGRTIEVEWDVVPEKGSDVEVDGIVYRVYYSSASEDSGYIRLGRGA